MKLKYLKLKVKFRIKLFRELETEKIDNMWNISYKDLLITVVEEKTKEIAEENTNG